MNQKSGALTKNEVFHLFLKQKSTRPKLQNSEAQRKKIKVFLSQIGERQTEITYKPFTQKHRSSKHNETNWSQRNRKNFNFSENKGLQLSESYFPGPFIW